MVIFCGLFLFKGWFLKQTGATHGTGWEDMDGYAAIAVSVFFLFIMACAESARLSSRSKRAGHHSASRTSECALERKLHSLVFII